jgi:3',5'-cyclic AMP phosphodiesterase CpdA
MLRDRYGNDVPALMAIAGDLTTNGTTAEGQCIKNEAAIAHGAPVVAVTGNHESETSVKQMEGASMTVLSGKTTTVAGVSALGAGDPERSELFGATHLRGDDTEADVGERLHDTARADRPDLLVVHEAYAAQTFLDVSDMTAFLRGRKEPTLRYDDGVRDVPASAVLYGHWHRSIGPRVVWNSDGTWTLVMELDTSGGAIDTPTIGHFSTPWSTPEQEASFPVLFLDKSTGLVTGYQVYRFAVDGAVTVQPRVDVGEPAP